MTEQISQRELRNDSGRVMRGLEEGRTFIVTRHSEPVGELRPLRRKRFVDAQAVHEIFAAAPSVEWARFRDDLDEGVSQDIAPRV